MNETKISLISAGTAIIVTIILFIIKELLASSRHNKIFDSHRLGNLYNFYFEQYLSDQIKEAREFIESSNTEKIIDFPKRFEKQKILARALQRVGIMCFTGTIPVEFAITMNGAQLVNDWVILKNLLRENGSEFNKLQAFWRHAEWLALLTWLRFAFAELQMTDYEIKAMKDLLQKYKSVGKILRREKRLRKFDKEFLNAYTGAMVSKIRRSVFLSYILLRKKPLKRIELLKNIENIG
ncbi:hypothetical protein D1BOALGB6SA_1057 [Olavius sp. associated proteobacterium Delta 1]|nr:hypothetical protein D1BOALGB6SA_1057 [Olavius sp. associated proteobacterium Delta 1]